MIGTHPYQWTVNLPTIKADIDDDDGYDGSDEGVFSWHFESFFQALEEEDEVDEIEIASYNYT